MSWHIEKGTGDIVIGGFEQAIASSPHTGIADMKNFNPTSMAGEVMTTYNRIRQTQNKTITNSLQAFASNVLVALAGSGVQIGLLRGTWITIASSSITNLVVGTSYYVESSTGGNITLSLTYEGSIINTFGTSGTAVFTVIPMGKPIAEATFYDGAVYYYFVLDSNGRVWITPTFSGTTSSVGQWFLIDSATTSATGIFVYGSYVHVVTDSILYKPISSLSTAWATMNGTSGQFVNGVSHFSIVGTGSGSGTVFICDSSGISTLAAIPGTTYNASGTNGTDYTFSSHALALPFIETPQALAEVPIGSGVSLVIGGISNKLYIWDEIAAFYSLVVISENNTTYLLTVNNLVFIFAGSKGNIYVTNGSSATKVIKVPDYIANSMGADTDPYFIWGGAMYLRGRVWFSVQAPNCGGIWSFIPTQEYYVEQDTGATLKMENQNSYGSYDGLATVLFAPQLPTSQQANGPQYWAGWDDGSGGTSLNPYAIDFTDTIPFTGTSIIETDAIPTGTFLQNKTFQNIEYKLSTPLLSGESIQIYYRLALTDAWTTCGTVVTSPNNISGYFVGDFQSTQLLQLQIHMIASVSSGSSSWCRLKEIRLR